MHGFVTSHLLKSALNAVNPKARSQGHYLLGLISVTYYVLGGQNYNFYKENNLNRLSKTKFYPNIGSINHC